MAKKVPCTLQMLIQFIYLHIISDKLSIHRKSMELTNYYVSGVKDEFVQLWVYLKDTNWTQFVLKSSLSANPNLFKDKIKGFTPFTQSSNSLVAQVIHFSGRVIGFRVGFYLKFKLIVRSGWIMDRLGRVFRFSGTRSSPRRHIWSLDNWTWDNWIHVQMSRSPNIRGGSGLRFSSSGGL